MEGSFPGGDIPIVKMKSGSAVRVEDLPDLVMENLENLTGNATGEAETDDLGGVSLNENQVSSQLPIT